MVSGEVPRGFAFLGGYAGCVLTSGIGGAIMVSSVFGCNERHNSRYGSTLGGTLFFGGMAGMVAVDIWSIVDEVNVAKVKNMYFQDQKSSRMSLELKPYLEPISFNDKLVVPVGVSLNLSF